MCLLSQMLMQVPNTDAHKTGRGGNTSPMDRDGKGSGWCPGSPSQVSSLHACQAQDKREFIS